MTVVLDRTQIRRPEKAHRPGVSAPTLGLLIAIVFAAALAPTSPAFAEDAQKPVTVTNLIFGTVCGPDDNRRICFQTNDIDITDEGSCVYNGKQQKCTWYGYSFDYQVNGDPIELQCELSSEQPYDSGNPKAELGKGLFTSPYTLKLESGSHHFFNPQYLAAPNDARFGKMEKEEQACSYMGKRIFSIEFRLHHPER